METNKEEQQYLDGNKEEQQYLDGNKEEQQYLDLIKDILARGTWEEGRNGKTKSIFGSSMRFSLANGQIPILTTKKTAWKTCLKELLWFIRVHIWDGNSSREFLDSRGLQNYEEDELGPIYAHQWRHFNAPYITNKEKKFATSLPENEQAYYNVKGGVDQLQQIIDALKDPAQRTSRRLIMTAWNPCQLEQMALPPCHVMCQFNVHNGNQLSCAMYQRSSDEFLGQPINIASYSFLTHLLAKHCGLEAYEFVYFIGNAHIYENAIDACKLQITREPYPFPTVSIKQVRENINDYQVDDFEIIGYQSHEAIKVAMVA